VSAWFFLKCDWTEAIKCRASEAWREFVDSTSVMALARLWRCPDTKPAKSSSTEGGELVDVPTPRTPAHPRQRHDSLSGSSRIIVAPDLFTFRRLRSTQQTTHI
jgi:hypothetical protein